MGAPTTIDFAAKMRPGYALNELVAREWMGWHSDHGHAWQNHDGEQMHLRASDHWGLSNWNPSHKEDHASEARNHGGHEWVLSVDSTSAALRLNVDGREYRGVCEFTDTGGDRNHAASLATCRAIAAALKAAEPPDLKGET